MRIVKSLLFVFTATALMLVSQVSHGRHAALLIDTDNGDVLYELEASQSWYPASLTKLMTLYMTFSALESGRLRLSDRLSVSSHAAHQPTSRLGLKPWESISVEDAILAITTRSANDAAVVLAERLSGSERQFAVNMTATAHTLGMYGSHFMNATGLPHDWQTTTAHDMALLAYKLIRNFSQYYPYFGVDSLYYNGRFLRSSNKFVLNYPGAEGMKTGYTCGSGYNLVATANLYGKRLIGVILGGHTSYERYQQMFTMMDIGYSNEAGNYRARNINTMSHNAVGTPPYQLSCGHKPSSHYAVRPHNEDDDDETPIRYVKKSLRPKHLPVKSRPMEELRLAKEVTKIRVAGKTKTIVKAVSTPKLATKSSKSSRSEDKAAKRSSKVAGSKKSGAKEIIAKTTKRKSSARSSNPVHLAKATSQSKGYYVPGKDKKAGKSTTTTKSKGYYTPDKDSKGKKSSKKRS